uniref:Protein NDRG3 n=1 Tax=Timema douglasi TaxID=61478 RepID=A0A7R8VMT0_TIMDO|nr:unnamed protein product [Timema douglasi]
MPSDSMDDIELKNIQLQFPTARTLARGDSSAMEERVETARGSVLVAVQGNRNKPAILTYHDLGLNWAHSVKAPACDNMDDKKKGVCSLCLLLRLKEILSSTLTRSVILPVSPNTCKTDSAVKSNLGVYSLDHSATEAVNLFTNCGRGPNPMPAGAMAPAGPQRKCVRICVEEECKTNLGKTTLNKSDQDSNLDLFVIGSLVYCDSDTLDYAFTEVSHISSFQAFFNYIDMRALLENFCVYHVNAPGQEEGATTLPEDYIYPTMEELSEQILFVMSHYALRSVIGFGVGVGANVLARFALAHPEKVEALCLVNCLSTQAGWIEWGYQKLNSRHLRSKGMTQAVLDYLMWHHFGRGTEERNHDLAQVYKSYFERHVNPTNLALFIDSYVRRTDLNITREMDPTRPSNTLGMPVMNITGALSPHVDDTVTLNGRLDPSSSTWMKIQDCGMVLEEQPGKVSEAFRLFLQGQGYAVNLKRKSMASAAGEGK